MKNISLLNKNSLNWFFLPIKILQSLPKDKQYKMLDVGAWTHRICEFLPKNIKYDSLDSQNAIRKGRLVKQTYVHNLNEFPIPIPESSYDIILCLETLEHTLYPHRVMRELLRISKPNALFLLSLPNDYNVIMRIYYLFGIKKASNPAFAIVEEHGHIHTLRKKDILEFYNKYLDIEEIKYSFSFRNRIAMNNKEGYLKLSFWRLLDRVFNFLAPIIPTLFARNIGVSGRKKRNSV